MLPFTTELFVPQSRLITHANKVLYSSCVNNQTLLVEYSAEHGTLTFINDWKTFTIFFQTKGLMTTSCKEVQVDSYDLHVTYNKTECL